MVHDHVLHDAPASKRRVRMIKGVMVNVTGDMGEMVRFSLMDMGRESRKRGTLKSPAGCAVSSARKSHLIMDAGLRMNEAHVCAK